MKTIKIYPAGRYIISALLAACFIIFNANIALHGSWNSAISHGNGWLIPPVMLTVLISRLQANRSIDATVTESSLKNDSLLLILLLQQISAFLSIAGVLVAILFYAWSFDQITRWVLFSAITTATLVALLASYSANRLLKRRLKQSIDA